MNYPGLDIRSACLFLTADPEWRSKVFKGGLVLLIPLIGWSMLLGYRKITVDRIWNYEEELLPNWKDNYFKSLVEGLKCCGIIFLYLLPATIFFWHSISSANLVDEVPWTYISVILFFFPIFSPLAIPVSVFYLMAFPEFPLSATTGFSIIFFYFGLVFLIPLAFIQVSISNKYLSAFKIVECGKFLARNFIKYIEAWVYSSIISLIGHFCIPFSPWGVTWAYLGIVYNFNEVLFQDQVAKNKMKIKESFYENISGYWNKVSEERNFFFSKFLVDDGRDFSTVNLRPFYVPLPRLFERNE